MKSAKYSYLFLCMILVVQGCNLFEEKDPKSFTTCITTIGGNGFDLATDVIEADDGYIISGAVGPQCDIVDGLIAKVDKETGSTLNISSFGNPNQGFEENFFSIAKIGNSYRAVGWDSSNTESILETPDGNLFIVGGLDRDDDSSRQIYCLKTDQSGNELSFDILEIGLKDEVEGMIRVEDGFVIVGNTNPLSRETLTDILIAKLDFNGKVIWTSCLDFNKNTDAGKSIIQTSDGGFVVVGRTKNEMSGVRTMLIAKTDAVGKVEGVDCSCD